jgi:hypothetical protein
MTGADGKTLLVVGVEEELMEAAQAVLRLMYEEVVPEGLTALQLAKVGTGTGHAYAHFPCIHAFKNPACKNNRCMSGACEGEGCLYRTV